MSKFDYSMIFNAGCMLILMSTFKWKIPHVIWDNKWFCLLSRLLGSGCIIMVLIGKIFKFHLPVYLVISIFALYLLLSVFFVITKIQKARNGIAKNLQIGICLVFILISVAITFLDVKEIASGFAILAGTVILLTTPFEEVIPYLESKKSDS